MKDGAKKKQSTLSLFLHFVVASTAVKIIKAAVFSGKKSEIGNKKKHVNTVCPL